VRYASDGAERPLVGAAPAAAQLPGVRPGRRRVQQVDRHEGVPVVEPAGHDRGPARPLAAGRRAGGGERRRPALAGRGADLLRLVHGRPPVRGTERAERVAGGEGERPGGRHGNEREPTHFTTSLGPT
jgi:hypothetical protein